MYFNRLNRAVKEGTRTRTSLTDVNGLIFWQQVLRLAEI